MSALAIQQPLDDFDDDCNVIESEDWRNLIAPYMQENVGVHVTAEDFRHMFGRPFRILRTLAGLSEVECASLLGWTLGEITAVEDRSNAKARIQYLKVVQALAVLALTVAHRHETNYAQKVWEPVLGEECSNQGVEAYLRFFTSDWIDQDSRLL